jgi:hypothetical protein
VDSRLFCAKLTLEKVKDSDQDGAWEPWNWNDVQEIYRANITLKQHGVNVPLSLHINIYVCIYMIYKVFIFYMKNYNVNIY